MALFIKQRDERRLSLQFCHSGADLGLSQRINLLQTVAESEHTFLLRIEFIELLYKVDFVRGNFGE